MSLRGGTALRAATLAALAGAAFLGTFLLRDAIAPVEANALTAGGQSSPSGPADRAGSRIRIEALGTERAGITGRPRTAERHTLAIGDTVVRFLGAGNQDAGMCIAKLSDTRFAEYLFLWRLQVTSVDVAGGQSTVQVYWTRWRSGNPLPERDETRTITLRPSDTHLLDYIENEDAGSPCASLIVRVSAEPILSEAARALTVNLWTVDESPSRDIRSVHGLAHGRSGESIDYSLPPLDAVPAAGNRMAREIRTQVTGTITGTIAADGFVDVTLTAARRTSSDKGSVQGEGRVQFRSKLGETAAVLLPEPTGRMLLASGASLDLGRLFAGHRLSLYVSVDVAR